MQTLTALTTNPIVTIFLGTLPLTGTILWGLLANDRRLSRIESTIDTMAADIRSMDKRLVSVETRLNVIVY